MSQEAANKIPRYALWALISVFLLNALWAQDLWSVRDAASFGLAEDIKTRLSIESILLPSIDSVLITDNGPFTAWIASIFMKLFGSLISDIGAYRLSSMFWCSISFFAIWYGTWYLTRHPDAQPLPFAFGGEASSKDYGRVIADCALLLYIATFGIVARHYEGAPFSALLAFSSLVIFGISRSLIRPYSGAAVAGLSVGLSLIGTNLFAASWLFSAAFIANIVIKGIPGNRDKRALLVVLLSVLPMTLWAAAAFAYDSKLAAEYFTEWARTQLSYFGFISLDSAAWILKNFAWYWLPLWPLSLWGFYSWRRQYESAHMQTPYSILITGVFFLLVSSRSALDLVFLMMVPALAVSAAFAIPSVKPSKENVLDWFSIAVFSIGLAALWLYWTAWATGFAPKMAKSIALQAPNAEAAVDLGFFVAAAATIFWIFFLVWRLTHRPVVAWRGCWLAATGMTACLVCVMGLFSQAVTDNRSYAAAARSAAAELKALGVQSRCVEPVGMPIGVQAALKYFGRINFGDGDCPYAMIRTRTETMPQNAAASFSRPHTDEVFWIVPLAPNK